MIVSSTICLLLLPLLPAALAIEDAESPQPPSGFLRYTFSQGYCRFGAFPNDASTQVSHDLRILDEGIDCLPDLGITSSEPNKTVSHTSLLETALEMNWKNEIESNNQGIAWSFWFQTPTRIPAQKSQSILTLKRRLSSASSFESNACDNGRFDFQINQVGPHLEIFYRTSRSRYEPCQRYVEENAFRETGQLVHVAATFANEEQIFYLNGQILHMFQEPFESNLTHWLGSKVSLFETRDLWRGHVFQISAYNRALSQAEVMLVLQQGLPQTPPRAAPFSITINEDAEFGDGGSHDVTWYRQMPSFADAETIQLEDFSVTARADELLSKYNLTSIAVPRSTRAFITRLPLTGRLYQVDGTPIGGDGSFKELNISVLIAIVSDSLPLRVMYLPPFNAHSIPGDAQNPEEFAAFQYCLSNAPIFHGSQCTSAIVRIRVRSINDPPVATAFLENVSIYEGVEDLNSPKMHLTGSDVDAGDTIRRVEITQTPKFGHLVLSVGKFRIDKIMHGANLSDIGLSIYADGDDNGAFIKYVWDPLLFDGVLQGSELSSPHDSFAFRVADEAGAWSIPETVSLHVKSALVGHAVNVKPTAEDSRVSDNIRLLAYDRSGYRRQIGYFMDTVPTEEEGVLLSGASGSVMKSGAIFNAEDTLACRDALDIAFGMSSSVAAIAFGTSSDATEEIPCIHLADLTFIPSKDYCNSHLSSMVEFHFRVIAFGDDGTFSSVSDAVVHRIAVKCKIDTLEVFVPTQTFNVPQQTLQRASSSVCGEYKTAFLESQASECENVVTLSGIEVFSIDEHQEEVRVAIHSSLGFLSFGDRFWNRTSPLSGRRALSTGEIVFVAYPADLTSIFSSLRFGSFYAGNHTVHITFTYGNCDGVLTKSRDANQTSSCQVTDRVLFVQVENYAHSRITTTNLVPTFPWQILLCLFGYPALYYLVLYLESLVSNPDDETASAEPDYQNELPVWKQHRTQDAEFYYENTSNGTTTWMAPVGEAYFPWESGEEEKDEC
jgi:hypothetical protein